MDYHEEPTVITYREVVYDPLEAPTLPDIVQPRRRALLLLLGLVLLVMTVVGGVAYLTYQVLPEGEEIIIIVPGDEPATTLSSIFTDEVHYWEDQIIAWADEYDLDPNLIATVIQIESCGDPNAGSSAGAQGLFQVMPFHFAEGEAMKDVQTNALRGLNYLSQSLTIAEGHAGLALAGYNGGHGVIDWGWARWPDETRRYYYWGVGIYEDARSGAQTSARLDEWLASGGARLCNQASLSQQYLQNS